MYTILKFKKIGETKVSSKCKTVIWTYPILLFIGWFNPITDKAHVKKWFSIIPAGGFHFLGLRVHWTKGTEIHNKREEKN